MYAKGACMNTTKYAQGKDFKPSYGLQRFSRFHKQVPKSPAPPEITANLN